jgi:hypothetical protein
MADTVSNHDLAVVTKGTDHLATTQGATDVCFDPPKQVPAPYEHFVPSTQLGAGQTTKTMIVGQPIVTKVGVIEPPANGHAGVGGGVVSGTYNDNAKPTGSSPDVKAEGNLVVRSTDTTTQNSANTTGAFTPPQLKPTLDADKGAQLDRCTIVKVIGICAGDGDGHGRALDFPPNAKRDGDGYYLEVLSKDTVTLTATRKNAIQAGGPVCPPALHTSWLVVRSGGGEEGRTEPFVNKDVLVLEPAWFKIKSLDVGAGKMKDFITDGQKDKVNEEAKKNVPLDAKEQEVADRRANIAAGGQDKGIGASKRQYADQRDANLRQPERDKLTKEQQESNASTFKYAASAAVTAAKLYQMWKYQENPVTLQISAFGCSGAKNVTLKSFPVDKIEFDMFSEKIVANVARLKAMADIVEKFSETLSKGRCKFKFLEGPNLTLSIQYKELTHDGKGIVKSQCNRTWSLSIGFEKFVEITAEFKLPLLNFLGLLGAAAAALAERFGAEGNLYFKIVFVVAPKMSGSWDEYNEWTMNGFSFEVKLTFELGVDIKFGKYVEFKAYAYAKCSLEGKDPKCLKEELINFAVEGEIQFGVKAIATVNLWGFSYDSPNWEYKPEWAKFSIPKDTRMGIVKL